MEEELGSPGSNNSSAVHERGDLGRATQWPDADKAALGRVGARRALCTRLAGSVP